MAITTYSELQTAIANYLDRSDLTARIPEFIDIAESYINDDLRVRDMIATATITPSQVNRYVSFPTGFIEPVGFTDDQGNQLQQLHVDELEEAAYSTSAGRPEYFSLTSRINFERLADSTYSYTMVYYQALDLASDTTNAVLTRYPNIYLYGALAQAEPYLKNDGRIATWVELYGKAMKRANNRAADSLKKLRIDTLGSGSKFDIVRGY